MQQPAAKNQEFNGISSEHLDCPFYSYCFSFVSRHRRDYFSCVECLYLELEPFRRQAGFFRPYYLTLKDMYPEFEERDAWQEMMGL